MNVSTAAHTRALADRLFAPTASELAAALPDLGESIFAGALDLAKNPQADRCEILIARLNGAVQLVNRLRAAIVSDSSAPELPAT